MKQISKSLLVLLMASIAITGCKKDDDEPKPTTNTYEVPTTYSFSNVNHSGQTARIAMLSEILNYAKTGVDGALDAQKLKDMFANENNPFTDADLNANTKNLKSKCFSLFTSEVETYFDKLATASQSTEPASNGVAGVATSGTRKYLSDANGIEYRQIIAKSLMGAVLYYQATAVYLTDEGIGAGVDNTTITPGEGTTMEHHWDEAFGYLGAPADFPNNTDGNKLWASYIMELNPGLNNAGTIMNAFLKGRAAISNKDYTTRDEQRDIIRTEWEKVCAAAVIHYMNEVKADFGDDAIRNHELSEGMGFLISLKFNPVRKITTDKVDELIAIIGDNFYEVTIDDLNAVKNAIATIYGFEAIKDTL